VVDEVLTVGDAEFQKKAIGKMKDVSQGGGRTVLFVSHNMDSMLNLCDNGLLLENGMVKYAGDIRSTVAEYVNGGNTESRFIQETSKFPLFISAVEFTGSEEHRRGLFSFGDDITLNVTLQRDKGFEMDNKTVMSIILMTLNRTKICNLEIPIGDIREGKTTWSLRYTKKVLMPNKYMIQVVTHLPNVRYYDRQDACMFTIFDNGTEFLKYNGTDNGFIDFKPDIERQ
jgi:lipopolysaccharide transport system ATP-binding protein